MLLFTVTNQGWKMQHGIGEGNLREMWIGYG